MLRKGVWRVPKYQDKYLDKLGGELLVITHGDNLGLRLDCRGCELGTKGPPINKMQDLAWMGIASSLLQHRVLQG